MSIVLETEERAFVSLMRSETTVLREYVLSRD